MLCLKVILSAILLLNLNTYLMKVQCIGCEEENASNKLRIKCDSFENLFKYSDPERLESVSVINKDQFICDEPMFGKFNSVSDLYLHDARILHISSDCFQGMNSLKYIDLHNNDLTAIEMGAFRASDEMKLRAIFLNLNHIVKIDFADIVLPEVTQFEANHNRLKYVKMHTENMPKISIMYLGSNQISRFQIKSQTMKDLYLHNNRIKSFQGSDLFLPNLIQINLDDNQLTIVTPDMFQNMPNLQTINLAHNLLTTVSFPNLPMASSVDLTYNRIKTMENVNISTFGQNYSLRFSSNKVFQLESHTAFDKLTKFTCHSCFIHVVEPFFFANTYKNIRQLELGKNYLTTANIFKAYSEDLKLRRIQLSVNKIRRIRKNDFERLSQVETLYLDHNDIINIESGAFDEMHRLKTLDISFNLLVHLPADLFENNPLKALVLSFNNMPFFKVPGWHETPGGNQTIQPVNSTLNNLKYFFIESNPLQCGCIDLLRSWANKNGIDLEVDDWNIRKGLKPACIVNDDGCSTKVEYDYIKDYRRLFNDREAEEIFFRDEEND
ncbi:leucine-rich repeat-containing G-protein coupled receptor 4-like [Phlebotomus argentipes]|uniref:leucine-rich repeat-containing G-protein coupled receptor 4-like n=1 Tax=Phlebotomus argentipes TaxID=94469 RepID=UPI0028931FA2|nr:leucine-rich repeat-containing G-protein coupled receptor 4-like [Phlebotomus argentipes]